MKKSKIAKFALMGASLAAVAATLGTSTYAWYVTNSTATAGNINITTTASGSGNLLLAQAKPDTEANPVAYNTLVPGNFTQTLNLTDANIIAPTAGLFPYTPGTYSAGALTADATLANWVDVDGNAVSTVSNCYAEFKIWVMSTTDTTVTYTLKLNNTTAANDKPTQLAYSLEGLGTTPVVNALYKSFSVDARQALRIAVTEGTTNAAQGGGYTYSIANDATYTIYDETATDSASTSIINDWNSATGMDANLYFHSILGKNPVGTTTSGNTTTYSIDDPTDDHFAGVSVTANQPKLLQFRVWLEGTDSMCFDSCGGQSFAFEFSFAKSN